MVYDAYFTMNKDEWINQENHEYREATERRFKEYYVEFLSLINETPKEVKNQIIMETKNRMYMEGLFLESITFEDWIKHILKTY